MKFEFPSLFGKKSETEKPAPSEVTSIMQEAIGVSGASKPTEIDGDTLETDEQKTPN